MDLILSHFTSFVDSFSFFLSSSSSFSFLVFFLQVVPPFSHYFAISLYLSFFNFFSSFLSVLTSFPRELSLFSFTILAINKSTALKCPNSLIFNHREMIFFLQNLHLRKIYQMRPSWFLYLYSFRNESQMNKTFAFCKCGWANLS